ncbi:MAG: hypothetical protein S4CHLAM2_07110 [Chlamydiales bacterium]|nr:hypothetical protein [Chlamydiales bacterium]
MSLAELFSRCRPPLPPNHVCFKNPHFTTLYKIPLYSCHGLTAEQKMRKQLYYAVKEGFEQKERQKFVLDMSQNVGALVDQGVLSPDIRAASTTNRKMWMEDICFVRSFKVNLEDGITLSIRCAVVCDGHGDHRFAGYRIRSRLPILIQNRLKGRDFSSITDTFTQVMISLDEEVRSDLLSREINEGGTTFTGVFFIENHIFVVNVGDGRAIICKKDVVYQLSEDADPKSRRFQAYRKIPTIYFCPRKKRIFGHPQFENVGGSSVFRGGEGGYNLARDIGSKWLSPRPKITYLTRGNQRDDLVNMHLFVPKDSYIVLAPDGLWGRVSNRDVYQAIWEMEAQGTPLKEMAAHLVYGTLLTGGKDNITVVIIKL